MTSPHAQPESERLVLGIESSCDETAAAVVRGGRTVLSNVIASQHDLHAEYRGVVPEIASRAHAERIDKVVKLALEHAQVNLSDIDAVAMGNRPGLIGSLLVGVSAAKALAFALARPLVGVDHVLAHLYAGFLHRTPSADLNTATDQSNLFPALGLVVSGGHSAIYRLTSPTSSLRLGTTRDDAIGEAYDKAAALMNLPFPGGPVVDKLAQSGNPDRFDLPVSRLEPNSLDFSFSGLKTALLYTLRGVPTQRGRGGTPALDPTDANIADLCAAFQHAAVKAVALKLDRAMHQNPDCFSLLVGGGVSANSLLRSTLTNLCRKAGLTLKLPAMEFCLDNAAMIAGLGHQTLNSHRWQTDPLTTSASASAI